MCCVVQAEQVWGNSARQAVLSYVAICKIQASPQQVLGCTSLLIHLLIISGANDLQQLRHQSCRNHFVLRKAWQYQLQQSFVALFANIARLT